MAISGGTRKIGLRDFLKLKSKQINIMSIIAKFSETITKG